MGIELAWLPTREGDYILKNPDLFYALDPPQGEKGTRFLLLWDVDDPPNEIQAHTQLYYYNLCDSLYGGVSPQCHPWMIPILHFICLVPSHLSEWEPYHKERDLQYGRWEAASTLFSACSTLGEGIRCVTHEDFEEVYREQNMKQEEPQWILTEKGYRKALRRFENRAMALLTAINSEQTYALLMPQYNYVMGCLTKLAYHVAFKIWDRTFRRIERVEVGLHFKEWYRNSVQCKKRYPVGLMLILRGDRFYLYDYEGGRRLRYDKEKDCVEETNLVSKAMPYDPEKHLHRLPKGKDYPHYLLRDRKKIYIAPNIASSDIRRMY